MTNPLHATQEAVAAAQTVVSDLEALTEWVETTTMLMHDARGERPSNPVEDGFTRGLAYYVSYFLSRQATTLVDLSARLLDVVDVDSATHDVVAANTPSGGSVVSGGRVVADLPRYTSDLAESDPHSNLALPSNPVQYHCMKPACKAAGCVRGQKCKGVPNASNAADALSSIGFISTGCISTGRITLPPIQPSAKPLSTPLRRLTPPCPVPCNSLTPPSSLCADGPPTCLALRGGSGSRSKSASTI